jgi:hypothetical protein
VVEDVQNIIKEVKFRENLQNGNPLSQSLQSVEGTLQNAVYHPSKVPQWTNNVVEQCMKRLSALNKPFKYVGEERSWKCPTNSFQLPLSLCKRMALGYTQRVLVTGTIRAMVRELL